MTNVLYKLKVARGAQAVSESIRKGIITPLSIAMTNDIEIHRSARPMARRPYENQHPNLLLMT